MIQCYRGAVSLRLIPVAEADREFKSMLAGKGSSGSDWLNVLSDQAFHLHCGSSIMDSKKIPAYLERFCKVCVVPILGVALFYFDIGYDLGTESMQYGKSTYLLNNVLISLGMKCLGA